MMAKIETALHTHIYKSRVHSYERYFILLMNRYHEVVNYWQLDVISHVGIHICNGEHVMAQFCLCTVRLAYVRILSLSRR